VPPTTRSTFRPRVRSSSVDAASVRRLAARRAARAEQAGAPVLQTPVLQTPVPQTPVPQTPVRETKTARRRGWPLVREHADTTARRTRPFGQMFLPLLLAAVTLALGGLAAWFGAEAAALNAEPSAQNLALADPVQTSQVTRQVTSAIGALFSYDYAAPGPTTQAAGRLLTGAAVREYAALFGQIQRQAPKQQLVITTTVTNAGVELLTPNTARVLVFAVESDRKADGTPATAGAMLAVNVVRFGGTWKIEGIDTFGG
jgi:Mce-associated membrane protein